MAVAHTSAADHMVVADHMVAADRMVVVDPAVACIALEVVHKAAVVALVHKGYLDRSSYLYSFHDQCKR